MQLEAVMQMEAIANRVLSAKRKRLFGAKPLFEPYRAVTESDLLLIEQKLHVRLPETLRAWLLLVGYGDIAEDLSFRAEWFNPVEFGALKGNVLFAQDTGGNFYSFDPKDGKIYFFSRSALEHTMLAPDFRSFMEELERRDFRILDWVERLSGLPYDWNG